MNDRQFTIDVEEESQENAVFFNGEFVCFEDDSERLVGMLNAYALKDNCLIKKINELEEAEKRLYDYFFEWFEEERGFYREDFNRLWASIKDGDDDD